jgi:hypothetical protein
MEFLPHNGTRCKVVYVEECFRSHAMREKRVVLLSNRSLLAVSIQRLLQNEKGFKLSVVAADDPEVTAKIKQRSPQVIIIDSGDDSLGEGVIMRLLEEHPKTRVIALNLNHVGIKVYQMKHALQTSLDGLLETIRGKEAPVKGRRVQPTGEAIAGKEGGEAMDQ